MPKGGKIRTKNEQKRMRSKYSPEYMSEIQTRLRQKKRLAREERLNDLVEKEEFDQ